MRIIFYDGCTVFLCWACESMWLSRHWRQILFHPYNITMCLSLSVLLFSSCHDQVLPQHHTSRTGSHDWDELHCSRWKAHQGSLGEGISYHQPRHEPLCGYCEGSGRWGHIHPAGERRHRLHWECNHTPHFKTHIQSCPGLAVSDRHHFLSKSSTVCTNLYLSLLSTQNLLFQLIYTMVMWQISEWYSIRQKYSLLVSLFISDWLDGKCALNMPNCLHFCLLHATH